MKASKSNYSPKLCELKVLGQKVSQINFKKYGRIQTKVLLRFSKFLKTSLLTIGRPHTQKRLSRNSKKSKTLCLLKLRLKNYRKTNISA